MDEYTPSKDHKLTYVWGGRGCVCGWSSGTQKTYNEGDRLAAAHMMEANR